APEGTVHHVVAVAQRRHAANTDQVTPRAADEAVGGVDGAARAAAAAKGHRPGVASRPVAPEVAVHHVVAVAQRRHAANTDLLTPRAADEAVGGADGTAGAAAAATGDHCG